MQNASDRIDRVVGDLIADGELSDDVREQVTDLLRNELYQNWQLKTDVKSGALSQEDAMARYEESHAAFLSDLAELVGEDTAEHLLARASGRAKRGK